MVDSRQKGARAEAAAKKVLIEKTGLGWERTPGSGALNEKHKLKGDLYIPDCKNKFCVEVKHYKDDHFTSKVLTSKGPQFLLWWEQAERQGVQVGRDPLLLFKFDRSKWFVAFTMHAFDGSSMKGTYKHFNLSIDEDHHIVTICKLDDFLEEDITWIL